jgi:hypothetical protein
MAVARSDCPAITDASLARLMVGNDLEDQPLAAPVTLISDLKYSQSVE